jgi:hypothetical protein
MMKKLTVCIFVISLFILAFGQTIYAEDITQGGKYTPVGAEAGPNETGEIPAWEGASELHKKCPDTWKLRDWLPDPFANDKVLYRIDHTNVDQYKHRLSAGQIERLKKNKFFYINVYPTHRVTDHCEAYKRETEENVTKCYLDKDNVLCGYEGGRPFPFPKRGVEAIWNVKKFGNSDDINTLTCRRVVSPAGKVRRSVWEVNVIFFESRRSEQFENPKKIVFINRTTWHYPPDKNGESFMSIYYIDDTKKEDLWVYNPALRRVRRAPSMEGGYQADGESTIDEVGYGYRAPVNYWDWKLLGKKEMYLPQNNYGLWQPDAPADGECLAGDMNPLRLRYELRRVWVIDAKLNRDINHPYSRRVMHLDEDRFKIEVADDYDKRDNLWRVQEYFPVYDFCQKLNVFAGDIYLNLESGRYELHGGCRSDDDRVHPQTYNTGLKPEEFTVQAMRSLGR